MSNTQSNADKIPAVYLECSQDKLTRECMAKNMVVNVGDIVYDAELVSKEPGYFGVTVGKIDSKGVELNIRMDVFRDENGGDKTGPWRVDYGETIIFMGFLAVKAEKGPDSTVHMTVTAPSHDATGAFSKLPYNYSAPPERSVE